MIYSLYNISLKLKTPSQEGKKINFNDINKDLYESLKEFNSKFRSWNKRLILTKIENNFFELILVVEKQKDKVSTREIRSFTAYLNKEKNWSIYSRESSKLFEGIKFIQLTFNEAKDIISNINIDSFLYKIQKDDIEFLLREKDEVKESVKSNLEYSEILTDEQAISIFDYLLKTKEIGNNEDKKRTVSQIKQILSNWV